MNVKLHVLAVAMIATLIGSALGASTVSAASFNSESHHTIVLGEQLGINEFEVGAGITECEEVTFAGTFAATSTGEVTVDPSYSGCLTFGIESEVDMNGCDLLMTANGQVHVGGCETGSHIDLTVLPNFEESGLPFCSITIFEQTINGMSFQNTGTGTTRFTDATANISGITYEIDGGGGLCGEEEVLTHDARYRGSSTVKGFNTTGGHVGTHHTP